MVIRKKKCRDCGNAITHNTCCPYCGSVDPFGYYRNTDHTAGTDYCGPADYCQRQSVCIYCVAGEITVHVSPELTVYRVY